MTHPESFTESYVRRNPREVLHNGYMRAVATAVSDDGKEMTVRFRIESDGGDGGGDGGDRCDGCNRDDSDGATLDRIYNSAWLSAGKFVE